MAFPAWLQSEHTGIYQVLPRQWEEINTCDKQATEILM